MRARQLGITLGLGTPGEFNAITDVPGIRVGHSTLIGERDGRAVRTGVTVVQPRDGAARQQPCFAGCHVLNGNGDATGLEWIREAGLLTTPIAITNTHSVGTVRDALIAAEHAELADPSIYWCMPVVMETYDGLLNDIWPGGWRHGDDLPRVQGWHRHGLAQVTGGAGRLDGRCAGAGQPRPAP